MDTKSKEISDPIIAAGVAVNQIYIERSKGNRAEESSALINLVELLARRPETLNVLLNNQNN